MTSGASTANSGGITLATPTGATTGALTLSSAASTAGTSGGMTLSTGAGVGGAAGAIALSVGTSDTGHASGITATAGASTDALGREGGPVVVNTGASTIYDSGSMRLSSADGVAGTSASGYVSFSTGTAGSG